MKLLLIALLAAAIAFAGCAAPSESRDDHANETADTCPADNESVADENTMMTDECVAPPASSNMCVEGAEDCEDTVEVNETNTSSG